MSLAPKVFMCYLTNKHLLYFFLAKATKPQKNYYYKLVYLVGPTLAVTVDFYACDRAVN